MCPAFTQNEILYHHASSCPHNTSGIFHKFRQTTQYQHSTRPNECRADKIQCHLGQFPCSRLFRLLGCFDAIRVWLEENFYNLMLIRQKFWFLLQKRLSLGSCTIFGLFPLFSSVSFFFSLNLFFISQHLSVSLLVSRVVLYVHGVDVEERCSACDTDVFSLM